VPPAALRKREAAVSEEAELREWRGAAAVAIVVSLVVSFLALLFSFIAWNSPAPNAQPGADVLAASLTAIEIVLAVLGVGLAVAAIIGYGAVRGAAIRSARDEAQRIAPGVLENYMNMHGDKLVEQCLDNTELVSALHRRMTKLGTEESEDAEDIDTEAGWEPE